MTALFDFTTAANPRNLKRRAVGGEIASAGGAGDGINQKIGTAFIRHPTFAADQKITILMGVGMVASYKSVKAINTVD